MKLSDERISPEYLKTQEEMHVGLHKSMQYGSMAYTLFPKVIEPMVKRTQSKSVFDYGCGKQYLKEPLEKMGVKYSGYDPAVKKYSILDISKKHDMVICVDVMEHVEEEYHDIVLNDILTLAKKFVLFTICPVQAKKVLSDGRNAHICIAGTSYWLPKLCKYFEPIQVANCVEGVPGFYVMCNVKKKTPIINKIGTDWDGSFKSTDKNLKDAGLVTQVPLDNKILKSN